MEIQSWFTKWRSKVGSHSGDPSRFTHWRSKPVHTMEIQVGSHPSRFTQWRSKPVLTMEIQGWFTQWRSKPVHKMEMQISSSHPIPSKLLKMYLQRKAYI